MYRHNWKRVGKTALLFPFVLLGAFIFGCDKPQAPDPEKSILIQTDLQSVTLEEFERAFETAKVAYSDDHALDPLLLKNARTRMLNQMIQELIIGRRATELGIALDDRELINAIEGIKKDYDDDEFEQMLLESAIPFSLWRDRLRIRLLMEKVIERDLAQTITISAQDIETYYKAHEAEFAVDHKEPPEEDLKVQIVERLRREKIEAAYPEWMESLHKRYQINVNWQLWDASADSDAKISD